MAGLDQAVEAVTGATPAWFVEYESAPSKILAKHYPDVPNYGDITKVDWTQVEPVDILTGGFPCQDLSLAGKRAGLKVGTRSGLWFEFVKAIEELEPRMVVIENVRGILSAPANSDLEQCPWCMGDAADGESTVRALGVVVATLATIGNGYDVRWQTVRASDAGAPHRRERVFIIGIARGGQELMPTPLTTSGRGYSNPEVEAGNPKKRLVAEVEILRRSETAWGKFEPVIRHWEEVMGRPAPEPTIQSSEEKRSELNPVFVEWMMSLPEGWVTGHGLSTKEELKILGNGVVPMQAALALRLLLGLEKPAERERERELIPTPTVFHVSMHNEPIEKFLTRQANSSTGQIGKSLGVALRMELGK